MVSLRLLFILLFKLGKVFLEVLLFKVRPQLSTDTNRLCLKFFFFFFFLVNLSFNRIWGIASYSVHITATWVWFSKATKKPSTPKMQIFWSSFDPLRKHQVWRVTCHASQITHHFTDKSNTSVKSKKILKPNSSPSKDLKYLEHLEIVKALYFLLQKWWKNFRFLFF